MSGPTSNGDIMAAVFDPPINPGLGISEGDLSDSLESVIPVVVSGCYSALPSHQSEDKVD